MNNRFTAMAVLKLVHLLLSRSIRSIVSILAVTLLVAACGGGGGEPGVQPSGDSPSANSITAVVNQSGGAITLADGTTVTFAAGLVNDGTNVTVSSTAQPALDPTQEVQALSPTVVIDVPPDSLLASAPADSVITVEIPVTGNTAQNLAAGVSTVAAKAGVVSTVNNIVQVTVQSSRVAGEIATYYAPFVLKTAGKIVAYISIAKLYKIPLGVLRYATPFKIAIVAIDSRQCTKQSTSLYQVDFLNGKLDTNIRPNGKPPLILVHGWQEAGIIAGAILGGIVGGCNKPYSSTWQTFLKEYSLDPAILDKFQVFSLAYSTSNPVFGAAVDGVVGSDFARIIGSQFGQEAVYVVAHSMGGLVARSALVNHGANIRGLVTLATPHHGTPLASQEGVDLFRNILLHFLADYIIGGEGIYDLAWDNFDGLLPQFHDRRGNLGNPSLDALNAQDRYRGRYVVFAGAVNEPIIGARLQRLKDDNDAVVPVTSALFYNSSNAIDSRIKLQKRFDGLSHFSITRDVGVLSETRAALLGFLSIPATPTPGIANGATAVSVNTAISSTFSQAIDTSTLNTSTFTLSGPGGLVAGVVTYNATTNTATFTPSAPLAYNTAYTATITTGVKDLAGNPLVSNYSWSFTTGGVVGTAPSAPTGVIATAASSSQINLSWNSNTESDLAGYDIYKGGVFLKSVSTNSASDTGLTSSTQYCYTLRAYDTAGNQSVQSSQTCATTLAVGTTPAKIAIGPASLNFGNVSVGSCGTATFAVQHVLGTGPASGTVNVAPASAFSIVSGGSFSVSNGSAANVGVQFCPTSALSYTGTATVTSGATFTGANSIVLSGTGTSVGQNLRLAVTANPDPVARGGLITYQLQVSNVGSSPLTNVVLQNVAPVTGAILGVVAGNMITGGGTCPSTCRSGEIITWPAFSLTAGQTQTVSFAARVGNTTDVPDGMLIHNNATVTYAGGSSSQGNTVVVRGAAGLHVGLEADHDPARPGDQITYTLTVGNTASQALPLGSTGILTAALPAGTSFVSASGGGSQVGNEVRWNIGSVAAGISQRYTYTVTVGSTLGNATVLQSQAQMWDGSVSLARAMAATEVQAASPLRLVMTANPDPVARGGLITYQLQVSNVGSSPLTNVVLQNVAPVTGAILGVVAGNMITGGGTCPSTCRSGEIITWPAFSLTAGQTQTVSFAARVGNTTDVPDGMLIHNNATVTYAGGSSSQGNTVVVYH